MFTHSQAAKIIADAGGHLGSGTRGERQRGDQVSNSRQARASAWRDANWWQSWQGGDLAAGQWGQRW